MAGQQREVRWTRWRRPVVAGLCLLTLSSAFPSGAGAAPVPPGAVVADSFDRPDSPGLGQADTGQNWMVFSGSPVVSSSAAEAPGPGYTLAVVDSGITAGRAMITIVAPTPEFWLVVRDTDTSNYWRFGRWQGQAYQLQQVINNALGSPVITMMTTLNPAGGDRLSCTFDPSGLACAVNGTTVVTTADPFNVDGRLVGLAAFGNEPARFDDLLVTNPAPVCIPSPTPAATHGSAFGVDASILGASLVDQSGLVATAAPAGPASQFRKGLAVLVPGLVSATVQGTASTSSLNPSTSSASATVGNLSLLAGAVTATTVRAASSSTASPAASSFSGAGTTIESLRVNGAAVTAIAGTDISVKLLGVTVAELSVLDQSGATAATADARRASHSSTALRLVLVKPVLGFPAGTEITVAAARTDATSPTIVCA